MKKQEKTYYTIFSANRGHNGNTRAYVFTNKKKAIDQIKSITKGSHFQTKDNQSWYMVYDENEIIVEFGSVTGFGKLTINHGATGEHRVNY